PIVSVAAGRHLAAELGVPVDQIPALIDRLLDAGPDAFDHHERGMTLWRCAWSALRLEERLRAIDEGEEAHVPPGLGREHLDDLLDEIGRASGRDRGGVR